MPAEARIIRWRGLGAVLATAAAGALCAGLWGQTPPPRPPPAKGIATSAASGAVSRPASSPMSRPASIPASAPATVSGATLGEKVNAIIDDVLAFGSRVVELPLLMLLPGIAVFSAALALAVGRLAGKNRRAAFKRAAWIAAALLLALAAALVVDRKVARLQGQLVELRTRTNADAARLLETVSRQKARRTRLLVDTGAAQAALTPALGAFQVRCLVYDEAADVIEARRAEPAAQAFLVIADLRHTGVEIVLDAAVEKKSLTSRFAKENDCTVAVNGEAGLSPAPDCGLGDWRGKFVSQGKLLLAEDPKKPRPYLSFDRNNLATYYPFNVAARPASGEGHNVIWGRSDALLNGVPLGEDSRSRQPRTAMGINKEGTRLYLLVVDGRQPGYSMGFTRGEVAQLLKAFGAHNAMLCDEGGSSCMYLQKLGGVRSIPSDENGKERPTYTHFGMRLRSTEND